MIDGSKIVEKANNYIGKIKYVFGSSNIEGGSGDCSSFTQYIYKSFGVNIGRDTQAQYTNKSGKSVSKSELSEGDLVFFKNTYKSNNTDGVSHVGIYMGGNDFIHLSSSGVKVSSLNENYWQEHYLDGKHFEDVNVNIDSTDSRDSKSIDNDKFNLFETLGVNSTDFISSIIIVLFLIGGVAFIGLSIGGI